MSVSRTPEDSCELDLVYVTERIIAVSFPSTANEENFRSNLREVAQMLKSKHGGNYLVRTGLSPAGPVPRPSCCVPAPPPAPGQLFFFSSFTHPWPRASVVAQVSTPCSPALLYGVHLQRECSIWSRVVCVCVWVCVYVCERVDQEERITSRARMTKHLCEPGRVRAALHVFNFTTALESSPGWSTERWRICLRSQCQEVAELAHCRHL